MSRAREPSIERTSEYSRFIAQLAVYHEHRGTSFDPEPRVGSRHVDLLKLYRAVNSRGGYDQVSSEKLAWRKLGQDFALGTSNLPALAFNLKTAYYKNLALVLENPPKTSPTLPLLTTLSAYEISTVHGRVPPPKEILEDVTARGGDLLTRTLENYKIPGTREQGNLATGEDSDGSADERTRTPKQDRTEIEEPVSSGRVTRGLRQAPPQRVLFHPDTSSTRQPRNATSLNYPPPVSGQTAAYNQSSNLTSMPLTLANYEPRPQQALTLRPVVTPGNNPGFYKEKQRILQDAAAARSGQNAGYRGLMLPGTSYQGPNIYVRTLFALKSGIPEEQDFALHHLVKISHDRGDKYRFAAFPGLAKALLEKVLEISSLFYEVSWDISYEEDRKPDPYVLNGTHGTPDLLQRIKSLNPLDVLDGMETQEFTNSLTKINEAALVLRNMVMLEENAEHLSQLGLARDFITIALNLPWTPSVVEIRHYAIEIAEQITKYLSFKPDDPVYTSLLAHLDTNDRGAILTSLRAISRISMNLDENNRLKGVPIETVRNIFEWTLLEDEDLVHACLDFLYQYTAVAENVQLLLNQMNLESLINLINHLVRLLLFNAKTLEVRTVAHPAFREKPATQIPALPKELVDVIITYDEPERSAHWLRSCFEDDPESEITQIALWQAYQARFSEHSGPQRMLLAAADFIKNVSTTFPGANAQVVAGSNPKFIIKGIKPRHIPLGIKGLTYSPCLWQGDGSGKCDFLTLEPKEMWYHLIQEHLKIPKLDDGKWNFDNTDNQTYYCQWGDCKKFGTKGTSSVYEVGMHVKTHLPDAPDKAGLKQKHNSTREVEYRSTIYHNTITDERGDASGLPLSSALVLRNLARNLPKPEPGLEVTDGGWMAMLFKPVEPQLWFVMAHNKPLMGYMADLTETISAG
ncbi:MAG: Chromatin structure-remodeling complex protein rsc9 [Trizodia sp. TS-e1964]|nr:MAG: Chromatin structure-remodeling complex protein rsc9 [Trizodia sp. TS-e1964]